MTDHTTPSFQADDRVIWWKQIPGGGTGYPVAAIVVKVTAKRVQIAGEDDGRSETRSVTPTSLQKQDIAQSERQLTHKQGQYLAFIHEYTAVNGRPPSEAEMQRFFRVTPPSVHNMIVRLEENGWIERTPGRARSIRVLISADKLPRLGE
jgi:DNA-binding MarR family transcriptional regulator